jgi:hypothetical protein
MTTWYVRPDTSHNGTRNGTSYSTAWGGWSAITWGAGGVVGGDTLYVCGAHTYTSAISVGAHGGSAEATRCTIRGDASEESGSITFGGSGSVFLQNDRAWTTIRNLTITAGPNLAMFLTDTATNCVYAQNAINGTNQNLVSLYPANGQDHANVTFNGNTFNSAGATSGSGSTIAWFLTATSAVSTLTNISVTNNTFSGCAAGRAVIHFRTEDDTDAASVMSGITVTGNTFTNCRGVLIELAHGHATANIGGACTAANNTATGCGESPAEAGLGGFFKSSGFSAGRVYGNTANGLQGAQGFANIFSGTYVVSDNEAENLTTNTIDGNGVLIDIGATNCSVLRNKFTNLTGKAGVNNSGCGVMVLAATGCRIVGNVVDGCLTGLFFGAAGAGQSATVANNTCLSCSTQAIYLGATSDPANCTVSNNICTGTGYSVFDATAVDWVAEDYNVFYGFPTGASGHTLGGNDITADPLLRSDYMPMAATVRAGGVGCSGGDYWSKDLRNSIGAVQYQAARSVVARSAATRSVAARSTAAKRVATA